MKRLVNRILIAGLCLYGLPGLVWSDSDWRYSIEPYLLAASIEGDAGAGRVTGAPVSVDFGDILETLEMAFMIHAEAVNANRWGIMFDYGFMDLGADIGGPLGGIVNTEVSQDIMELMFFKRAKTQAGHYDIYAGIRWWDNDVDIVIDPGILPGTITTKVDESWVDPVIGARLYQPLDNKWTLLLRGDVGGFGIGSDFTALLSMGASYRIKQDMMLNLRYQGLWVDYEDGTAGTPGFFAYDTVTHGPVVGLQFNF